MTVISVVPADFGLSPHSITDIVDGLTFLTWGNSSLCHP